MSDNTRSERKDFYMGQYKTKVMVLDRKDLEAQLDSAVDDAIMASCEHPDHGILVTRHTNQTFTVALSPNVPGGTIREHDARLWAA
ncbi:hypothetical protein [Arthrobacter sp. NPDC057013]|uniref:hypothetical protein n=1 Tax=Arthrobacter sp. NPDC057013 TaxID=3345999 RepID=UPI0036258387